MSKLTVGLCQITVGSDKKVNLATAADAVMKAKNNGAQLVVLPECYNSPYSINSFSSYAEAIPKVGSTPDSTDHPSSAAASELARTHGIYLVAGSIPEADGDKLYNTSVVYDPEGVIIAKHRKVHLFDIDIPGKMTFQESAVLSPGNEITTFPISLSAIGLGEGEITSGLGICYDLRFPEYALSCRSPSGSPAELMLYPGAFNTTTGPAHWSLLTRGRALDMQAYVCACSPSRNADGYPAYGHSMVVDPYGVVLQEAEHGDEIVTVEMDLERISEVRKMIPVWKQRRGDLYHIVNGDVPKSA